jgi:flagellar assembly protein FliH
MSSPSFEPLVQAPAERVFRPLGTPAEAPAEPAPTVAAAEPAAEPAAPSEDVRKAFQAGYELGREELRSDIESIGESFVKSLQELAAFRARLRGRYERELLELALGVARKVVQQELAERPEIWLGMIRDAVRRAVDRERIAVRVPPAALDFLRQALPELRTTLEDVKELELIADPSLPLAGCVIESRFGEIDIGVDTQLEGVRQALVRAED